MNRIILAASLASSLVACSQDADIGIDSQPVTCGDVGGAEVTGRLTIPASTGAPERELEFGDTSPRVVLGPAGTASTYSLYLTGREVGLNIGFQCGPAELAKYGVVEQTREVLDCPHQVTGAISGQTIQYLGAQSGTLIVDDNANCLAGRFAIDFGDRGALAGWFSSAWQ